MKKMYQALIFTILFNKLNILLANFTKIQAIYRTLRIMNNYVCGRV